MSSIARKNIQRLKDMGYNISSRSDISLLEIWLECETGAKIFLGVRYYDLQSDKAVEQIVAFFNKEIKENFDLKGEWF